MAISDAISEGTTSTDAGRSHLKCYIRKYAGWRQCWRIYVSKAQYNYAWTCIRIARKQVYLATAALRANRQKCCLCSSAALTLSSDSEPALSASPETKEQQHEQLFLKWATAATSSPSKCLPLDMSIKAHAKASTSQWTVLRSSRVLSLRLSLQEVAIKSGQEAICMTLSSWKWWAEMSKIVKRQFQVLILNRRLMRLQ